METFGGQTGEAGTTVTRKHACMHVFAWAHRAASACTPASLMAADECPPALHLQAGDQAHPWASPWGRHQAHTHQGRVLTDLVLAAVPRQVRELPAGTGGELSIQLCTIMSPMGAKFVKPTGLRSGLRFGHSFKG